MLEECARYLYLQKANTNANDSGMGEGEGGPALVFEWMLYLCGCTCSFLDIHLYASRRWSFWCQGKSVSQLQNWLPTLIFWKQSLTRCAFWNPFPVLICGPRKMCREPKPVCWDGLGVVYLEKRPLSQTFVKIMMRNLRSITSSCQNALCKSTMWLQQPFSPMLRSSSNSVVCNC